MKWHAFMWDGVKVVFVIDDGNSFVVWDEFGDFGKVVDIGNKVIDAFDRLEDAVRYIEMHVGKVVSI